jgi:hypothetical protein
LGKGNVVKQHWHAAWQGQDIVVTLKGKEVDRVASASIRRVIFVENGLPQSASDHAYALLELDDAFLLFPADSGFAGLVHFERQSFWATRPCVHWVSQRHAELPARCHATGWFLRRRAPVYTRLEKRDLASLVDGWSLEGPQTWEQRRL